MNEKMYLLDCEDSSFCVVEERELIFCGRWKKLVLRERVSFLWKYPDEEEEKEYAGIIIDISSNIFFFLFMYIIKKSF